MKYKVALLALLLTGCTPFEREMAEEVVHEVEVAEEAVVNDLECPGMAHYQQGISNAQDATLTPSKPTLGFRPTQKSQLR